MGIDRKKLEAELAELEALFPTPGNVAPVAERAPQPNRAALEAELAELERLYPTKTGFAHRAGQLGRGIITETGDVHGAIGPGNRLYMPDDYTDEQQLEFLGRKAPGSTQGQMMSDLAGLGQEYEPEAGDTLGKVLNFGGKMLAPTPFLTMGGYGNVVSGAAKSGLKGGAKALAKDIGLMGAQAGAIKATPRFTEEGGIPGAIEDIVKGAATNVGLSYAGRGASALKNKVLNPDARTLDGIEKTVSDYLIDKVGIENVDGVIDNLRNYRSSIGYKPLTAEIAENDALAQLYRAQKGVAGTGIDAQQAAGADAIKSALEGAKRGPEDIAHTQDYVRGRTAALEDDVANQIDTLSSRADVTETGRKLQGTLIDNLKEKEQARRAPTTPMYEALDKNFSELAPTNALDVLNNTVVKGDVKADYDYIKKQLMPEDLSKADMAYKKSYEKALANLEATGAKKQHIEKFKESAKSPKSTNPTVAEISAVRRGVINTMLEKFEKSGEKTRATMVRKVKEALDKDLQAIPEQRAADALFRELSGPVSEITENKALRAVTKERHGKPVMSESRVPGVFINTSAGSIDDARALLRQIHDKPESLQMVRDHLHEKAIASIADPKTGVVSPERIEAFKNKHPGAKILYPDLYNVKLKDLSHAQFAVNKFMDKTNSVQKSLERDAFCNLVGGDTKDIMPAIFTKHGSAKKMTDLAEETSKDASGKARRGLQNETIDYFEKSISNRSKVGKHHVLSYDKMRKFVDNHEKALSTVLEPNQLAVVKEVEKIVGGQNSANTRGVTLKSDSNANIRNSLDISSSSNGVIKAAVLKLGISTPLAKKFVEDFVALKLSQKEAVLNRALRDTEYADFLMSTPLKSKKDALEFYAKMKNFSNHRYMPPTLMELAKKEQSKKE